MRPVVLYLRARRLPSSLVGAALAVAVIAVLGGGAGNPVRQVTMATLAIALALGVLGYGLGGADAALERTTAIRWLAWRAAHVVAVSAVVATVALLAFDAPGAVVLRDTVGLGGLTALAATAFGNQLAWTLPVAVAGASMVLPVTAEPVILRVLSWPTQPAGSTVAMATAVLLAAVGLLAYATRGAR